MTTARTSEPAPVTGVGAARLLPDRLRKAARRLRHDRVALRQLAEAHGSAAQGTLLVLLAVPCVLPVAGIGTVLGVGLAAIALSLWRGESTLCLPARVAGFEMSRRSGLRVLLMLARLYEHAGRLAGVRRPGFARVERHSWAAAMAVVMAVLIVLPIPLGNVLPALCLVLLGIAMVFRDGLSMLLASAVAVLAVAYTAWLGALTWHLTSGWLMGRLGPMI